METYANRTIGAFANQVPRFIMLAENKIARGVRNLGYIVPATGNFAVNDPSFEKPARWRQTVSFNYTNAAGKRVFIYPRSYDFCRQYAADQGSNAPPAYYGDYDYAHYYVAPTPDSGYAFELVYHERPEPLSESNQTNWTTQYAPATDPRTVAWSRAMTFLKNLDKVSEWQSLYDAEVKGLAGEEAERAGDDRATKRVQT